MRFFFLVLGIREVNELENIYVNMASRCAVPKRRTAKKASNEKSQGGNNVFFPDSTGCKTPSSTSLFD